MGKYFFYFLVCGIFFSVCVILFPLRGVWGVYLVVHTVYIYIYIWCVEGVLCRCRHFVPLEYGQRSSLAESASGIYFFLFFIFLCGVYIFCVVYIFFVWCNIFFVWCMFFVCVIYFIFYIFIF